MPFDATARTPWAIPFAWHDYLERVEWTGKAVHPHKRGHLPEGVPSILQRLGFNGSQFIRYASRLLKEFGLAIGKPEALADLSARRHLKYLRGIRVARRVMAQVA